MFADLTSLSLVKVCDQRWRGGQITFAENGRVTMEKYKIKCMDQQKI